MSTSPFAWTRRGFTLVELLIVIAVSAVILVLAAPSMRDLIVMQRLKSTTAELVTDLQFARSEAVARGLGQFDVQFRTSATSDPPMSCYMLFIPAAFTSNCDCTRPPGAACSGSSVEIRTTQIPLSHGVQVVAASPWTSPLAFTADGMITVPNFVITTSRTSGAAGQMQVKVGVTGRPAVCTPDQSVMGVPAC